MGVKMEVCSCQCIASLNPNDPLLENRFVLGDEDRMLIFFALLATSAAPETAATPAGKPGIKSTADYPPEALKNGWEGDVVAELTVDATGKARDCTVAVSSGHKVLDDATCDVLIKRARFKPGQDKDGNPVEERVRAPAIRWRLSH